LFVVRKHPRTAEGDLVRSIRYSSAQRVVVFCHKRDETQRLVNLLTGNDIGASCYHSGVSDRTEVLQAFLSGTRLHDLPLRDTSIVHLS
jgi:superfamily II DNA helicase RecQ